MLESVGLFLFSAGYQAERTFKTKGVVTDMSAGNFYPEGIGKHIVCIYAGHWPPLTKQLVGANPEPHKNGEYNSRKTCGKCEECKERYENKDGRHAIS